MGREGCSCPNHVAPVFVLARIGQAPQGDMFLADAVAPYSSRSLAGHGGLENPTLI